MDRVLLQDICLKAGKTALLLDKSRCIKNIFAQKSKIIDNTPTEAQSVDGLTGLAPIIR